MSEKKSIVREWRERHRWSGPQAAEQLGMKYNTFKKREQGVREVPRMMLQAMLYLDDRHPVT